MKRLFKFSILMTAMIVAMMAVMFSCKEDDKKVETKVAVTGIRLDKTGPVTLKVDETLVLVATVEPPEATNKDVVWSNDPFGIVLMLDGMIKGLSPGTVTVTASSLDGDVSASVVINVPPVLITHLAILEENIKIQPGETATLTCIFEPSNATDKTVTWSSDAPGVASVDEETGVITGVSDGTAVITATTVDGSGLSDNCSVRVTSSIDVTGVKLSQSTLILEVGGTKTLSYEMVPSNATNTDVTWKSDDPSVASVDEETGEITGMKPGTTTITVIADEGGYTDDCVVTVSLLKNGSFEEPDSSSPDFEGWEKVQKAWFDAYYGGDYTVTEGNLNNVNRVSTSDGKAEAFLNAPNGSFFPQGGALDGLYAATIRPNLNGGLYQVVQVEPNTEYEFSLNMGFRRNTPANQAIRDDETVKILRNKDASRAETLIYELTVPTTAANANENNASTEQIILGLTGRFTTPSDVTEIRFQFDIRNDVAPNVSPLVIFDKCILVLAE